MKKTQLIIIFFLASFSLLGQEYSVKFIGIDSTTKYSLPPKPDSCYYLYSQNEIVGHITPDKKNLYDKRPKKSIISLYNGEKIEVENLEFKITNHDASIFYVFGYGIPDTGASYFYIYDKSGNNVLNTSEYKYIYPFAISDDGHLVIRTQHVDKNFNNVILYSPAGKVLFDVCFYLKGISSIAISPLSNYVATIYHEKSRTPIDSSFVKILDNNGNTVYEDSLYFSKEKIIHPPISFIDDTRVCIIGKNHINIVNIETKKQKVLNTNIPFINYTYLINYNHLLFIIREYKKYRIAVFNIDTEEYIYINTIPWKTECTPFVEINNSNFNISFNNKTYKYEIIKN